MTTKHTITVSHFEHCLSSYVTDWSGIVVGVEGRGQTVAQMAKDIVDELHGADHDMPDDVTDAQIRAAVLDTLAEDARFWPVDENGGEVNTDERPEFLEEEHDDTGEASCYWFRITVEERE